MSREEAQEIVLNLGPTERAKLAKGLGITSHPAARMNQLIEWFMRGE